LGGATVLAFFSDLLLPDGKSLAPGVGTALAPGEPVATFASGSSGTPVKGALLAGAPGGGSNGPRRPQPLSRLAAITMQRSGASREIENRAKGCSKREPIS